ncbi:hypothetical protein Mpet_2005 [Methanolacinia petrolearia DSM 11571]|uniref:Uncharacterized protein n=1 Tax=Methanolacinia petrolearia (strain DSM 11571 / OCM 486 / SEBR 4847) TaxID=679926 RepID=E1RJE9_METP4|nr:hypothetical protein [Methanolacinia petrolearia]ADN36755.1 hypothetical protein Mpet_2005 [Methanolacinia petrolearia DSM 11571]
MNKSLIGIKCLLVLFLLIFMGGIVQVSADDKIIVKEIPDEFSQNDSMRIFVETTYPAGSIICYNFTLVTSYPHRGRLSGHGGQWSRTRLSEGQSTLSKKISLKEHIPGDWKLAIWEEDHKDQEYVKMIHIFPDTSIYGVIQSSGNPDICRGTSVSNPKLRLDNEEDGVNLAKGQALNLIGEAPADSEIGVWIYSDTVTDDFPVYKKISADCNGNVDGEILSVFDSYTLPPGEYFVYAVPEDSGLTEETEAPAGYSDFEDELDATKGVNYQKFDFNAEDPWISLCSDEEIMAVAGTVLTFEGETNLKDQTLLEVLINPTAVDQDNFGNLIKRGIRVEDNGPVNKWNYTIDTSGLGAGEYLISVESTQGLGNVSCLFNVFDGNYSVEDPGEGRVSVTSYVVDKNTKDLKAISGSPVTKIIPSAMRWS